MKLYTWNDVLAILNGDSTCDFMNGAKTGISVGCFDGLHKGHRKLISSLTTSCRAKGLKSGVVTFSRPLPSVKHSSDYKGDLTTLSQRIALFEQLDLDFAIIVDFDDSFASMLGADFLNILLNICNMELLAEGIDFRCGFKGATDAQAIRYWAQKNGVETIFENPVIFKQGTDEEERISSSVIRSMIQKGFFTTANELLTRPYELDIDEIRRTGESQDSFYQILPPDGLYRVQNEKGEIVRLQITDRKILELPDCSKIFFNLV